MECRYRIGIFLWSQLNLPDEVIKAEHNDRGEHVWLEVCINNKWIILDPSWDIGLAGIFSINYWDGISDTKLAVNPIEILDVITSADIMDFDNYEEAFLEDLSINGEFYKALNIYFDQIRSKV